MINMGNAYDPAYHPRSIYFLGVSMNRNTMAQTTRRRVNSFLGIAILMLVSTVQQALAAPSSVTIFGSLQTEIGCASDFDPACAAAHLVYDAGDDVWQRAFSIPASSYVYLAALNDNVSALYGANATLGGGNIALNLAATTSVKFYYDDKSHWVTDNKNARIVVAPGNFQSELGCSGDFDPGCLRSWLQDVDGDGIYQFLTSLLPAGSYEAKAAIDESFTENYGLGGIPNGANIPFTVPFSNAPMLFSFSTTTNVLTITAVTASVPEPATMALFALGFVGMLISHQRRMRRLSI